MVTNVTKKGKNRKFSLKHAKKFFPVCLKNSLSWKKMNSMNDSVIICDSPSPTKSLLWMDSRVPDYRRRLRSSTAKNLLTTVYESPLMHFKRNKISDADKTIQINDVTIVHSPPVKKRKTGKSVKKAKSVNLPNLEESVVIVNDSLLETTEKPESVVEVGLSEITEKPESVVEVGLSETTEKPESVVEVGLSDTETNDVIEVLEEQNLTESLQVSQSSRMDNDETARKQFCVRLSRYERNKKKGKEKIVNLKNAKNSSYAEAVMGARNVNDENDNGQIMETNKNDCSPPANGETEDVEVVWVSGPETRSQEIPSIETPYVIDPLPSLTTLFNVVGLKRSKRLKRLEQSQRTKTKTKKRFRVKKASKNCETQQPEKQNDLEPKKLREIVIDGPNVAMGHTCGKSFSEKGLKLVIDYFKSRGHVVKAFLPQTMRTRGRVLLEQLHKEGTVVFTPSRHIGGKTITPYDDRYILEYATQCDGIVVSSDQYRDLWLEKPQWRNTIENRLLTPTFAGDYLMFPEDPLGRSGPKLDEFLRH